MKTSKKILIVVAGFFIILLITFLLVLRNDMKTLMENQSVIKYKAVPVYTFDRLEFKGRWNVRIIAGRTCKLELAIETDTLYKTKLENKDGTLYLNLETTNENKSETTMHARVTAPLLRKIKAMQGTQIHMQNYSADSIRFVLEDSCVFTGKDNQFKFASFKTSGESSLQFTKILN